MSPRVLFCTIPGVHVIDGCTKRDALQKLLLDFKPGARDAGKRVIVLARATDRCYLSIPRS